MVNAYGQEYRATMLGTVTDPAGAVVPKATVHAVNTTTSVRSTTETNGEGSYTIPFLLPGNYRLTVEHPGFRTVDRGSIILRVGERIRIDVKLEVGSLAERIEVVAESPLIESDSANRGPSYGTQAMESLPVKGRNPWTLASLSAGVLDTNNPLFPRPQDGPFSYSINGGRTNYNNEVLMDGQPRDIGWKAIPQEAVQEVKVVTNTYDAQYGHTSGGVISIAVKAGTSTLHGAGYYYVSRADLNANSFANNRTGATRPDAKLDQYGFELDGPVILPHIYNGKGRTFFTAAWEKWVQDSPYGALTTVPTDLERKGDFSQSLTASGAPYTIYDPLTLAPNPAFDPSKPITLSNLQYLRTPFAGNLVPANRISTVGKNVVSLLPQANQPGNNFTHANNYFQADGNAQHDPFQDLVLRVDHNFNSNWKMYARYDNNIRDVGGPNGVAGWHTALDPPYVYWQRSHSAVVDLVDVINPRTILNMKFSGSLFMSVVKPLGPDFDQVKQLGLPASLVNQLDLGGTRYPAFSFQNYSGVASTDRFVPLRNWVMETVQASVLRTQTKHTLRVGFEFRPKYYGLTTFNGSAGNYGFARGWTSSNPNVDNAATGNAIASMLLGYMNNATVVHNTGISNSWFFPAVYFQDDWRVSRRLTVNWGLRWDYEAPVVERYDRQARGFAYGSPSPIQVPGLNLTGGLMFAGVNGQPRGAFNPDRQDWQPRLGVAYKMADRRPLVFRAGVGRFFLPTSVDSSAEIGINSPWGATTAEVTSTPGFLPAAAFDNPFKSGLIQAPGSSQGLATLAGSSITVNDLARHTPSMWQYSAGFQFEVTNGVLLEATYSGSQTRWLPVSRALNYLTRAQLALGEPYLNTSVPNPFYGVLPANTSLGAQPNIARRALMTPYPQFPGVTSANNSMGYSWYNSAQFRMEYRLRHGLATQLGYTIGKTMEAVSLLNPQDGNLYRQKAAFDRPQRFVASVIYSLPVGPKAKYLNQGWISHVVGGWDLTMTGVAQSGVPIVFSNGNYALTGDPTLSSGQTYSHWFDTSSSLWVLQPAGALRTVPNVSQNIRGPIAPQFDIGISRTFQIHENHKFQFRALAYNATNTPLFGLPNTDPTSPLFGTVTLTQTNLPREISLNFRYSF